MHPPINIAVIATSTISLIVQGNIITTIYRCVVRLE